MKKRIQAARGFLAQAQTSDGGWPYRAGAQSSPEPTCYSLLALSTERRSAERTGEWGNGRMGEWGMGERESGGIGEWEKMKPNPKFETRNSKQIQMTKTQNSKRFGFRDSDFGFPPKGVNPQSSIRKGLQWLGPRVDARGAVRLDGDDEPHWSTSLLVITLTRLQQNKALRDRCAGWLLSWESRPVKRRPENLLDGNLIGWPWLNDTFGWVEPTCYAVLALKLSGRGDHPRVAEAERLLLDRACPGGGWNYGNRVVLGRELLPFIPTTALAILALQDVPEASQAVQQGLMFLRREVSQHQSTLSLALTLLCLDAVGDPASEFVQPLLERQQPDGSWRQAVHLTALAVLSLESATGGLNVFKL